MYQNFETELKARLFEEINHEKFFSLKRLYKVLAFEGFLTK